VITVRHPCHWLLSFYHAIHRCHFGIPCLDVFHQLPQTDTFDQFVDAYLTQCPGAIFEMVKSYNADVCLRIENAPWCFIEFLAAFDIDGSNAQDVPIINAATKPKTIWSPSVFKAIAKAEREMIEFFDYRSWL
jgi:hypothetical protein